MDEYLKKHDSEVNLTTIYRYLDKLAKDGTVIKYVAEKGCQAAYQYVEPDVYKRQGFNVFTSAEELEK